MQTVILPTLMKMALHKPGVAGVDAVGRVAIGDTVKEDTIEAVVAIEALIEVGSAVAVVDIEVENSEAENEEEDTVVVEVAVNVERVNGVVRVVVNEAKVSKVVKEVNGVEMVNVEGVGDAAVEGVIVAIEVATNTIVMLLLYSWIFRTSTKILPSILAQLGSNVVISVRYIPTFNAYFFS